MSARSWSDLIDATAKKLDLAIMFNADVTYRGDHREWLAATLRQMARILDRDARERARIIGSMRLLGLKFTVSRDG